jgi:hypothetical protein
MSIIYNELLDKAANKLTHLLVSDGSPLRQSYWNHQDGTIQELDDAVMFSLSLVMKEVERAEGQSFIAIASTITGETYTRFQEAKNNISLSEDEDEEGESAYRSAIHELLLWDVYTKTLYTWPQ